MPKLVLLRHGQSVYNKEHEFTGWTDTDLTKKGIVNAKRAAMLLKAYGFHFDVAYTSVLNRAIRTLWIVLDELNLMWIPVHRTWRLNERHYGALQEINKDKMAEELSEEQIQTWRRSYDVAPPSLDVDDERHAIHDPRYVDLKRKDLPDTESLKDCINRVLPYWKKVIVPQLKADKEILIAAHGNSIRGIIMYIDNLSKEEVVKLNIPTAFPLVYELDKNLKPVKHYYLGNKKEIDKAISAAKNQGISRK